MGRSNGAEDWRALQMLRLGMSTSPLSVHTGRRGAVRKGIVPADSAVLHPAPAKPGSGASHMNGTETIAEAEPYPYTSLHDGNAHRIRALFHRLAEILPPSIRCSGS